MPVGRVKWFDCKRGFGFVVTDDKQDVFIHYSVIEEEPGKVGKFRRLNDGDYVEYEAEAGNNGLCATHARKVEACSYQTTGS